MVKKEKSEPKPTEESEAQELKEYINDIKEIEKSESEHDINAISHEIIEPELNEAKHKTFLRLARPRTQKVLNSLKILGNCSNKSSYAYTEEEILKIFDTIKECIIETEAKFQEKLVEQKELFEF